MLKKRKKEKYQETTSVTNADIHTVQKRKRVVLSVRDVVQEILDSLVTEI